MAKKNLVIVESPAKATTIKKYLGEDFTVLASYGHVRDLLPKTGAVEPAKDFAMHYVAIDKNAARVDAIVAALKKADSFYLATDPDREGEAIAWHICELMRTKSALKTQPVQRIVFHEITKAAVKEALDKPRDISMMLVDAQQARRALDYLVGFNLSPLLWKKIRYGLSAGRVQSPALRMIVTREEEIEKFISQEYWTIIAQNRVAKQDFNAKLIIYQGEKLAQFSLVNQEQVENVKANLLKLAQGKLQVCKVEKKKRMRYPSPPFTTSTIQQEASRKLGYTAKKIMSIAQKLYEAGHITYMRTDSVNLAKEALTEIRGVISKQFGAKNLPQQPVFYKTKTKNAQEAHEAIRPTTSASLPKNMASKLTPEQLQLYTLIWQRTIACQMIAATLDTVTVDLQCGSTANIFRANGSVITDPGFLMVYQEEVDDASSGDNEKVLPPLKEGDEVDLLQLIGEQHFTEPPPRYTEATLIKTLEEYGIGRPSTYASIIDTLTSRDYVIVENKRFKPTDVGRVVNGFLVKYFTRYVDYEFTAHLEDELDDIATGKYKFIEIMQEFWQPFKTLVDTTMQNVKREDVTQEVLTDKCPKCGKNLTLRLGKNGKFIGCSAYPECDYTTNVNEEADVHKAAEVVEGRTCPECKAPLHIKVGRYGKFIGCSNYPKCKFIESLNKPVDTKITCPECGVGTMLQKRSRYGKNFYACSSYPKCKYALWNEPILGPCPKCGWKILTLKTTKRRGTEKICPQKECGFSEPSQDK